MEGDHAAQGGDLRQLAAHHAGQLHHGSQAHRHAHRVGVQPCFRAGDGLEVVQLHQLHVLHAALSGDLIDGVGQVEGHAGPAELVGVYTIAADGGGCLHHGHHVHAGLKHLIGDDEAYVARAHHDYPGAGLDMVKIDHGLGGAGGHHSRQGGAPEVQVVLVGAGGNDDLFGSDGLHAVLAAVQGQVVLKNAVDRMAQQDLHVVRFRVRQQMLADVEAPHARRCAPGSQRTCGSA